MDELVRAEDGAVDVGLGRKVDADFASLAGACNDIGVGDVAAQELVPDALEVGRVAGVGHLVEDDDAVGRLGRSPDRRSIVARPFRGRGSERDLEIGLDLRIIGREDAVTGVGGLTMDGLAALEIRIVPGHLSCHRSLSAPPAAAGSSLAMRARLERVPSARWPAQRSYEA